MFDMRYHIASLVAVFLALAIGIILGTVIVDKGLLVEQQTAIVERLEKDFGKLREDNAKLSLEVQRSSQYIRESVNPLIKDRLAGQSVAVVITAPVDNEVKRSLLDALKRAGATYSCVALTLPWNFEGKSVQDRITPLVQGVEGNSLKERALLRLADHYAAPPGDNKIILELAAAGLISVDAAPVAQSTSVLIIGGSDGQNSVKEVDSLLIERLKVLKVRVVGVETTGRKTSYMNAYQRAGIPTVDNLDENVGLLSTILALGGVNGNFGIKPTANMPLPTMSN